MKYKLDKLEKDRNTFIRGEHCNIQAAAYKYAKKHNLVLKVKKLADGSMITLLEGEQPLVKERKIVDVLKDNFMTKSDMIVKLDRSQIETLIAHRNNLDYRVINNIDGYTDKCILFEESRNITKFINQNK
jgi:hypothetical protein